MHFNELTEQVKKALSKTNNKSPFVFIQKTMGYASYTFNCELTEEFTEALGRDVTEGELITLVDRSSAANFGYEFNRTGDRTFRGKIYTD